MLSAHFMSSTIRKRSYSFSICSLNLARSSRESFLGIAASSSSTLAPQNVHL